MVPVIVLIALIGTTAAACENSDKALVNDLIYRQHEAWNNDDYEVMYEMTSPNYREIASYGEYIEYLAGTASFFLENFGTTNLEVKDIEVRIEDSWAFTSYMIVIGGERLYTPREDIFRKVEGKWYDVAEVPLLDPGYNEEDLPPGY